jgi:hypothetical protein
MEVSTEQETLYDDDNDCVARHASKYQPCAKCTRSTSIHNPFDDDEFLCRNCCMKITITATDAKKLYRLNEDVLELMPVWEFSSRYHDRVRRFAIDDIKVATAQKYGTSDVNEISQILKARRSNVGNMPEFDEVFEVFWEEHKGSEELVGKKTAFKRYKQLIKKVPQAFVDDEYELVDYHRDVWVLRGYIEDWDKVERFMMLKSLIGAFNDDRLNIRDLHSEYRWLFDRCLVSRETIDATANKYKSMSHRKRQLIAVLNARGVQYRQDSTLCDYYIRDDFRAKSLMETVEIMENMQFLHTHTNYAEVYKRILNKMRNRNIRRDEYDDSYFSREKISTQAQKEVMRNYRGNQSIVPQGLLQFLPNPLFEP